MLQFRITPSDKLSAISCERVASRAERCQLKLRAFTKKPGAVRGRPARSTYVRSE
jgi:hypothetical protein